MAYDDHEYAVCKHLNSFQISNTVDPPILLVRHLSLEGCKDTMVGSSFQRGISSGQRKRVSIGIRLLGKPSVLFMDEPTSGLDSFVALEIISLVKSLTCRGLTTISTIHAPTSSIFALFDTLMILLDGRTVYLGDASAAMEFFKSFGIDGPQDSSPADWLPAIVVQTSRLHRSEELARYYKESELYSNTVAYLKMIQEERPDGGLGMVLKQLDIPSYWKWLVYLNHFHYSWAALMTNQFTEEDVIAPFNIPILEYFSLDSTLSAWDYLGYEVIFIIVFFLFGSLALRFINYGKR